MPHNKNINNDLEHLADLGYDQFPGAEKDVEELKQKIKARAGARAITGNTFLVIAISLFLGVTIFFAIYNAPILFPSRYESLAEKAKQNIIQQINLDTIDVSGKTKRIKAIPTEKFSEPLELDSSVNFGKAEELEVINEITVGENSVDHDNLNLKYSPNAPYIYLYDLKIANYNGYYFKTPQRVVVHGSLEANKDSRNHEDPATQMPYREYYLHDVIKDAMRSFKQKDYSQCITLLDLISDFSTNDVNCEFYRGMCYYYLQNYEAAYKQLKLSRVNKINVFEEETNFYLSLTCLKTSRDKEAMSLLENVVNNKGFYAKKAQEMMTK
ncbi:MAG: hypothetical protein IPI93_04695 [Sphingobacteriaceae bacterium]|nr:hypothetical protein [Sphingobacteriaceae bacterium]